MTIQAQLADGTVLEFPDGTDPNVIQTTVKRLVSGEQQQAPSLAQRAAGVGEAALTAATGAIAEPVSGLVGLASAPFVGAEQAADIVGQVQKAATFQPRTEQGRQSLQTLGDLVQAGVDIAEIPISGLAGLSQLLVSGGDIGQAAQQVRQVQERGVGRELGEQVFSATGSPAAAAIAEALPTGALELAGVRAPQAAARRLEGAAQQAQRRGQALTRQADQLRAPTPEEGLERVSEGIKKGTPEEAAALVQPDPAFFKAADELNINVEPLASFSSQNPQFRAIEQGLASIPGSQLDAQGKEFISQLGQRADQIITEFGGTLDKAELSDRFRADSLKTVDDLGKQADLLYDTLREQIPAATRIEATSTVDFIRQKASELGGVDELPARLKSVLRQLETKEIQKKTGRIDVITGKEIPGAKEKKSPTYSRLDQTRKEVGQAINSRSGPFKDQETGLLKALYNRLRSDQDSVADSFGAADVSESATGLIIQRKQIEDNLSKLLGRDLQGSILPRVGLDLKRLARGDIQRWDSTMKRIPKNMRQEIVVTSLNDIFRGNNTQGQALNPTQFTKFMDDLDRSPAVKNRLFRELPEESIQSIENLRKLSKGVSIALQDKIPTGRVAAFFDDNQGFLRRMMGNAVNLVITAKAGPLAAGAASEFINQSSNGAKSAAAILASPKFQGIIRSAVREGVSEGAQISDKLKRAEKAFERSEKFKRWSSSLADDERAQLASVGTIGYLLGTQEEEE